jgi:hypothetical protein
MNCAKCDNVFKRDGEIHDNCHINDDGELICPTCVQNKKCDCSYCSDDDDSDDDDICYTIYVCNKCGRKTWDPMEIECSDECDGYMMAETIEIASVTIESPH